jgi:heme/copper-type cytochrome/quinol oxidase subunit 2
MVASTFSPRHQFDAPTRWFLLFFVVAVLVAVVVVVVVIVVVVVPTNTPRNRGNFPIVNHRD